MQIYPSAKWNVERKNKHIVEVATRAMLNEKQILDYFWAKALATIVYMMNRITPTASAMA